MVRILASCLFAVGVGGGGETPQPAAACQQPPPACTANPKDTDGDCLPNDEESKWSTDPQKTDTDCDGLSDYDEIYVFRTQPTNRDSDNDAAGIGGKGTPDPTLYDGSELNAAFKKPSSPTLPDTDGDGMSDYEELQRQFNPAVAEVPVFAVEVDEAITVQIWTGETDKDSTQIAINTSRQQKKSDENVAQHTLKNETDIKAKVGLNLAKITSPSISKFDLDGGWTRTDSFSNTTTLQLEQSRKDDVNRAYDRIRNADLKKASLTGRMRFVNNGRFAVDLQNVKVSFFRFDPQSGTGQVIAAAATPQDKAVTVGTGDDNSIFITFDTDISIEMARALLENPSGLGLQVDSFEPTQPTGGNPNFKAITENVVSYANTLIIDYGVERDIEKFSVANQAYRTIVNSASPCTPEVTRTGQRCQFGVSMKQVLGDYLNIDYATFDTGALKRVRDVDTQVTNTGTVKGYWAVSKNNVGAPDQNRFEEITLRPPEGADVTNRDVVSLVYVKDEDGDGLIDREELAYGTDYQNPDTDGDGLTDHQEIREGWTLAIGQTQIYSNPLAVDADGDLLNDAGEKAARTNPRVRDTDGDGLGDGDEVTRYKTNPANPDSDGDSLADGQEIAGLKAKDTIYTSDPLARDTDGDTLDDPIEHTHFTNPRARDTDGDTLDDNIEVNKPYGPHLNQYGNTTDPTSKDTDADGLGDAEDQYPLVPSNNVYLVNTSGSCANPSFNPLSSYIQFAACPYWASNLALQFNLQSSARSKDGKILIPSTGCLQPSGNNWIVSGDCGRGLSFVVEKWEQTDFFKIYRTSPTLCLDQDTFSGELELTACSHTEDSQKFKFTRK